MRAAKLATVLSVACGSLMLGDLRAEGTHSVTAATVDCVHDQLIPPSVEDSTFFAGIYALPYFFVIYPDGSQHRMWGETWIAEYESAYGFPNLYSWGFFPSANEAPAYGLPRTVPVGSTYAAGWYVVSVHDANTGLVPPGIFVWATNSAGGYYCSNAFQ